MRKAVKQEKNRKIKKINIILICFFSLLIVLSSIYIVKWFLDNGKTKNVEQNIEKISDVSEVQDSENTEIVEQEEVSKDDPYWDFIKMNLINVDFAKLKEKNSSTVGWIQVNGTNINYPFVQVDNNE